MKIKYVSENSMIFIIQLGLTNEKIITGDSLSCHEREC